MFSNYRPVHSTMFLQKTCINRCIEFINDYKILNEKQCGFRPNHSTSMAIIQLVDKISTAVETNQ